MTLMKLTRHGAVELSADEIADLNSGATENLTRSNRNTRDTLLDESDWTQMPDSPLTDEAKALWVTYRTALRDLTAHENWPNLEDADWPTKP